MTDDTNQEEEQVEPIEVQYGIGKGDRESVLVMLIAPRRSTWVLWWYGTIVSLGSETTPISRRDDGTEIDEHSPGPAARAVLKYARGKRRAHYKNEKKAARLTESQRGSMTAVAGFDTRVVVDRSIVDRTTDCMDLVCDLARCYGLSVGNWDIVPITCCCDDRRPEEYDLAAGEITAAVVDEMGRGLSHSEVRVIRESLYCGLGLKGGRW